MENDLSVLHTGRMEFVENTPEICRFCLDTKSVQKHSSDAELIDLNIPHLYEVVTNKQLFIPTADYPIYICLNCVSQMEMVAKIRQDFLIAAEFWTCKKATIKDHSASAIETAGNSENDDNTDHNNESGTIEFNTKSCTRKTNQIALKDVINNKEMKNADDDRSNVKFTHQRPIISSFECDICGKKNILKRRQLQLHMSEHRRAIMAEVDRSRCCPICGKTNLKHMTRHMKDHRLRANAKMQCPYCKRGFSRHTDMIQHQRIHTGERPFICEICAFTFTSTSSLLRHHKLSHIINAIEQQQQQQNDEASTTTLAPNNNKCKKPLTKEQRIRTITPARTVVVSTKRNPLPKLICPLCKGEYVGSTSLSLHMRVEHAPHGKEAYRRLLDVTCMLCNEQYSSADELAAHKVDNHYQHVCGICAQGFDNKRTLAYHEQRHSKKERKHKCAECNRTFVTAYHLSQHFKRTHTDVRPFVCNLCSRSFAAVTDLNLHLRRTHLQLKPYRCDQCTKTFKSSTHLRSHRDTHTGQFRYSCNVCNRICHSGPQLTVHMREYHPDEEEQ